MKILILVAHGSRREESNDEVRELARVLDEHAIDYDNVIPGFLELAEPSIPSAIRIAANNGANEIVVLPYFLSAGRHVVKDIPAEVESTRSELPGIDIKIAPYLGIADGIADFILKQATEVGDV